MKVSQLRQIIREEAKRALNEETGYERHESLNESVTEEEIAATIKLMDRAAKAAGFQLQLHKVNTKPKKRLTLHAVWTATGEQYSGRIPWGTNAIYLLWAKPHGLYVSVSQRGEFPVSGKPQDWTNKLKWARAFE